MSLKQSAKDSADDRGSFDGDVSNCWHRERERVCLRIEVSADEVFVFPYQQFVSAHHLRAPEGETLKITLSTHEVVVAGSRLQKLVGALQEFAVDWIRPVPKRYRDLGGGNEPVIGAIDVRSLTE